MNWRILLIGLFLLLQVGLMGCTDSGTINEVTQTKSGRLPPQPEKGAH